MSAKTNDDAGKLAVQAASLHGSEVASELRKIADRADKGEIIGVSLVAWTADQGQEFRTIGIFRRAIHLAHYAVSRLKDALLYPDDVAAADRIDR